MSFGASKGFVRHKLAPFYEHVFCFYKNETLGNFSESHHSGSAEDRKYSKSRNKSRFDMQHELIRAVSLIPPKGGTMRFDWAFVEI